MAQSIQTRRPPQRQPMKRARYISFETWETWKNEIYTRYIEKNQSLEDIMDDFRDEYNFNGTCVAPLFLSFKPTDVGAERNNGKIS